MWVTFGHRNFMSALCDHGAITADGCITLDRKRIYANPSSYPNSSTNPNTNPNQLTLTF